MVGGAELMPALGAVTKRGKAYKKGVKIDVEFDITDADAPYAVLDSDVRGIALDLARMAAAGSPRGLTGNLARSWEITPGRKPAVYMVHNTVTNKRGQPYSVFVEYGGKHNPRPAAMLGRAVASIRGTRARRR
jgi:hypothetical protein